MPLTERDIEKLVSTANSALRDLQSICGRDNVPAAKIRFPRKYLDSAEKIRQSLPRISNELQRRNASYALINLDLLRWLVIRTDINKAALSVLVKNGICILGHLCDWMTREANKYHPGNRKYTLRTNNLVAREIITDDLKDDLDWVWEIRCKEHIHLTSELEHDRYSRDDMNKAIKAFNNLRDILIDIYGLAP